MIRTNLVFGNSSLQPDLVLVDLDLPDPAIDQLPVPGAATVVTSTWSPSTAVPAR